MSKPQHSPSSRRSRYQKFSDKVFSLTGMPVERVVTIIVGLLVLGWAIQYAMREDQQASDQKTQIAMKQEFLSATTIPQNFFKYAFPIKIEKLDGMIDRCNQLLNQKNQYTDRVQEKRMTLYALKSVILAENGIDPAPFLELFKENANQIAAATGQQDKYQYLKVSTYMKVLAADPDSDFYPQVHSAISAIQEATPVPRVQAITCFKSATEYFDGSKDKAKAGKILQMLGEKMAMAKDQDVAYYGSSLIDYPNFFSSYQGSILQSRMSYDLESEVNQLVRKLTETPPRSLQTYDTLMNVPEQLLRAKNKKVALMVLQELASAAASSDSRTRDHVLPKLQKLKTRIELLMNPFPLTGLDAAGRTIELNDQGETILFFFNPNKRNSIDALSRFTNSPLLAGGATTTYVVPSEELLEDSVLSVSKMHPTFIAVDGPTSEDWMEKGGIEQVPFAIRLDKAGIVQDIGLP